MTNMTKMCWFTAFCFGSHLLAECSECPWACADRWTLWLQFRSEIAHVMCHFQGCLLNKLHPQTGKGQWQKKTMESSWLVGFSIEVAPPHLLCPQQRDEEHWTHTVTMQSSAIGLQTTHFWPIAARGDDSAFEPQRVWLRTQTVFYLSLCKSRSWACTEMLQSLLLLVSMWPLNFNHSFTVFLSEKLLSTYRKLHLSVCYWSPTFTHSFSHIILKCYAFSLTSCVFTLSFCYISQAGKGLRWLHGLLAEQVHFWRVLRRTCF